MPIKGVLLSGLLLWVTGLSSTGGTCRMCFQITPVKDGRQAHLSVDVHPPGPRFLPTSRLAQSGLERAAWALKKAEGGKLRDSVRHGQHKLQLSITDTANITIGQGDME